MTGWRRCMTRKWTSDLPCSCAGLWRHEKAGEEYTNLTDTEYLKLLDSPRQVAAIMGMTAYTVRKWVRDNRIPACRQSFVADRLEEKNVHFNRRAFILAGEFE